MVSVTRSYLVDDLDGSEAVETVRFSLDRQDWEIDLSPANADRLREQLQRFVDAATPVKSKVAPAKRGTKAVVSANKDQVAEIRRWAAETGIAVSSRGRLSRDLVDKYDAAH